MKEIFIRIVVGGMVVSAFALLGDMLRPKSFAGLLGAAPSVALATLALTVMDKGNRYAAIEAKSMILGAASLILYAVLVSQLLIRRRYPVFPVAASLVIVWIASAFGLWFAMTKGLR